MLTLAVPVGLDGHQGDSDRDNSDPEPGYADVFGLVDSGRQ
jgi:hypothetical protein